MNNLTEPERLRRVVLLCCHFIRNLTYYQTGHDRLTSGDYSQILVTIDNNFLDVAVLEWCKLFGDKRSKQRWSLVVSDITFEGRMLQQLGVSANRFSAYVDEMREYRDKFIAHLDEARVANIPVFSLAKEAVEFLHQHLVEHEASEGDMTRLPTDLAEYEQQCRDEMSALLDRCNM